MGFKRNALRRERQEVDNDAPKSMLDHQVVGGGVNHRIPRIAPSELLVVFDRDTILVRDTDSIQELGEHFTSPFHMHRVKKRAG